LHAIPTLALTVSHQPDNLDNSAVVGEAAARSPCRGPRWGERTGALEAGRSSDGIGVRLETARSAGDKLRAYLAMKGAPPEVQERLICQTGRARKSSPQRPGRSLTFVPYARGGQHGIIRQSWAHRRRGPRPPRAELLPKHRRTACHQLWYYIAGPHRPQSGWLS